MKTLVIPALKVLEFKTEEDLLEYVEEELKKAGFTLSKKINHRREPSGALRFTQQ